MKEGLSKQAMDAAYHKMFGAKPQEVKSLADLKDLMRKRGDGAQAIVAEYDRHHVYNVFNQMGDHV